MPQVNGLVANLANHVGQTVTIFTTSGGQSGRGFTGVLASVNCDFVRLITQIGPAPGCALGNCCDVKPRRRRKPASNPCENNNFDNWGALNLENNVPGNNEEENFEDDNFGIGTDRIDCTGRNGLGSIVDIPINKIASFVHNAVGSGW